MGRGKKEGRRERRPDQLGPRVYRRGRYFQADLRPWGGGRTVLRNPRAQGWPDRGGKTEDEEVARRWAWEYVSYHRDATSRRHLGIPDPAPTLEDATLEWLRARSRSLSQKAYEAGRTWANQLLDWYGPRTRVDQIEAADLQKRFDAFHDQGYKISTLHTARNVVSAFFRDVGQGHNPASEIDLPDLPPSDAEAWTDEEVRHLRDKAPSPLHRRAMELALNTGGRKMELAALRWGGINEREKTVRFTRQANRTGNAFRGLKGKTNRTALVLPGWWEHHDPDASGLILPDDGGAMSERKMHDLFTELLEAANLNETGVGAHRFRHTYARLFLEMGGWLDELQRSMGHASIRTTENTYGHFQTEKAAYFARDRIYGDGRARRLRVVE